LIVPTVPPRVGVRGEVRQIRKYALAPTERLEARQGAALVLLTDEGGFLDVQWPTDALDSLPAEGEHVDLVCEIGPWNRRRRDGQGTYSALYCRAVRPPEKSSNGRAHGAVAPAAA
jgi:hypothetical protein